MLFNQYFLRANAFRYEGNSCEIGRVSPFYGFLENQIAPKVPQSGWSIYKDAKNNMILM